MVGRPLDSGGGVRFLKQGEHQYLIAELQAALEVV